jgi:hypothetical protein
MRNKILYILRETTKDMKNQVRDLDLIGNLYIGYNDDQKKKSLESITALTNRLKKIYPKLDYCIGVDNMLKVYTLYDRSSEGSGLVMEVGGLIEYDSPEYFNIGTFVDYRQVTDGTYESTSAEFSDSPLGVVSLDAVDAVDFKGVIDHLDRLYTGGVRIHNNYYGDPRGDKPMFDWRDC